MQITVRDMDGGETFTTTLADLFAENDFDDADAIRDALTSGQPFVIGGGAAPAFEIARVAEAVS